MDTGLNCLTQPCGVYQTFGPAHFKPIQPTRAQMQKGVNVFNMFSGTKKMFHNGDREVFARPESSVQPLKK